MMRAVVSCSHPAAPDVQPAQSVPAIAQSKHAPARHRSLFQELLTIASRGRQAIDCRRPRKGGAQGTGLMTVELVARCEDHRCGLW